MTTRIWMMMLAFVSLAFPPVRAQGETVFYRVVSSTNSVITAFRPDGVDGFISWSNEAIGVTGSIQRSTTLTGSSNWVDFASFVAGSNVMVLPTCNYMVVDLSGGTNALNYPVSYLSAVPDGGWTDEYKTTKMVFRRIPAGTFTMGSPTDELGHRSDEIQHQVIITQPFYMGVFEVTQKQWERVMGDWPSYFNNASYRDSRPVEQVSYYPIRENPANSDDPAVSWPTNSVVNADSFMGRLRARTGKAFDLPTEAQWEYAGRAGTTTALNSGENLTGLYQCPNMSEVGRYTYNCAGSYYAGDTSEGTAKVGSYLPNAWGLYDIHGNVREWCLDWYGTYPGTVSDPVGGLTGSGRVIRGSCWGSFAASCRVGFRDFDYPGFAYYILGFRVALTPGQ